MTYWTFHKVDLTNYFRVTVLHFQCSIFFFACDFVYMCFCFSFQENDFILTLLFLDIYALFQAMTFSSDTLI